jgi:NAD+ diphosphatase
MAHCRMTGPGFTGHGIDRGDNLRRSPETIAALAAHADARLMQLVGSDPLLGDEGRLAWTRLDARVGDVDLLFLGLDDGRPLFAPLTRLEAGAGPATNLFAMIGNLPAQDAALWATARSLIHWHDRHGFCGKCGGPTTIFRAGWGRRCGNCGLEHFPRVDPVVIMLAEHEGRVLVARQPHFPAGRYSALAGFVEPGESIEEAVARELLEEAGIAVGNVRYVASQPWPFPGALMIACLARAESDALTIDTTELEDACWIDRAGVRAALAGGSDAPFNAPPAFAVAHTLFERWLDRD